MKIAVIGGDGTGPEVVAEGLKVLKAVARKVGFEYETKAFNVSGERYLSTGGNPAVASQAIINPDEVAELRTFDVIYLGAVGHDKVAPGILETGLLLKLRFELDQYINLRPVKLYPNVWTPLKDKGPADIDFTVIRENTEDVYSGMGGTTHKGTPNEIATQVMVATRFGVERAIRYAFETCRRRNNPKHRVTLVGKNNVLTQVHGLWFRAFQEIGKEYPDIEKDYNHVDACCMWFVKSPEHYDTVVTSNLFGDIITDLAAMIQGGMGVASGGNINPQGVSMFEPIGGSAPKYTGLGVINPIAAIGAMAMLLRETGSKLKNPKLVDAGDRVEAAILATTPKMKSMSAGKMGFSTSQVGDMVAETVAKA